MTLYEINEQIRNALPQIDPETGEVTNAAELDQLRMDRDEKIENIALVIKNDSALVAAIKAEAEAQAKRAKTLQNRIEWLKGYLASQLTTPDGREKFQTAKVQIGWRRSSSVEFEDEPAFCLAYPLLCKTKTEIKPDKAAVKKAIEDGQSIRGAAIVDKVGIQIK